MQWYIYVIIYMNKYISNKKYFYVIYSKKYISRRYIFICIYIYTRYIYMYIYIVKKKCKKKQIYSIICVFTLCVPPLLSFYSEKRFKTRGLFPYMVRVFWAKSVCQLLQPWQTDWVPCHAFLAAKGLCRARLEIRTCRTFLWLPPNPRQAKGVHRSGTSKTICIILLFKQSQIQGSWKNVFVVAETSSPGSLIGSLHAHLASDYPKAPARGKVKAGQVQFCFAPLHLVFKLVEALRAGVLTNCCSLWQKFVVSQALSKTPKLFF
jgi:hypothetical protein